MFASPNKVINKVFQGFLSMSTMLNTTFPSKVPPVGIQPATIWLKLTDSQQNSFFPSYIKDIRRKNTVQQEMSLKRIPKLH